MKRLLLVFFLLAAVHGLAVTDYVMDNAGVFSPDQKAALTTELHALESKTNGVQFVVFTVDSIPPGYDLESYALSIAEENKIGKKGADNGILFLLAVKDRKYRWEVGYGVEGTLNAGLLGRISRDYMEGPFKAGNYADGILAGVSVVEKILSGSTDPDIQKLRMPEKDNTALYIFLAFFAVLMILAFLANRSANKGGSWGNHIYFGAGSAIGGWHSSGGFSGGGFSGGGGSFGGGGHSGGF